MTESSDHRAIAVDRHVQPKGVAGRAISGGEFLLLAPDCAGAFSRVLSCRAEPLEVMNAA
jgi:hypothetical protein